MDTLNRSAFVAVTAGATALGTIASALAAGKGFGQPHPPIVAENDPGIVAMTVQLDRPDVKLNAYIAHPKTITATTPGVVIVHAIWGVDAQMRDTVRRYAKEGYICIAPALFQRTNPPSGDGLSDYTVFRASASALTDEQTHGDLKASFDAIRKRASESKIGVTGFCMGGGIALKQVIGPNGYGAAAIFYGDVRPGAADRNVPSTDATFDYAKRVTTPVAGSWAGLDTGILPGDVLALEKHLTVPHDIKIYAGANHAFFDDTRKAYDADTAADAWTRTLAWFKKYLA